MPSIYHVLPGSGWALTPRQMAGLARDRAASPRIRKRPVTMPPAFMLAGRPSGSGAPAAPTPIGG